MTKFDLNLQKNMKSYYFMDQSYYNIGLFLLHFSCDGFHLGEDEIKHVTVDLVLDSLNYVHCLTEAKQKEQDFLSSILEDDQLMIGYTRKIGTASRFCLV